MSNVPLKHHFIPRFHLKEFTKTRSNKGKLYVFDLRRKKTWRGTPETQACESSFYLGNFGPHLSPLGVESSFSKLEHEWSLIVRSIIDQDDFPEDEESRKLLLAFVSFGATRVPLMRFYTTAFANAFLKDQGEDRTIDQLADKQTWDVQMMLESALAAIPELHKRTWYLLKVAPDAPDLICSDNPIHFGRIKSNEELHPLAFSTPDTLLTFPLGRRHLLISTNNEMSLNPDLDARMVAFTNSKTAYPARQIYSSEPDFTWLMPNDEVGDSEDLKKAMHWSERGRSEADETAKSNAGQSSRSEPPV